MQPLLFTKRTAHRLNAAANGLTCAWLWSFWVAGLSAGSSLRVSCREALLTTALLARMISPPLSLTPDALPLSVSISSTCAESCILPPCFFKPLHTFKRIVSKLLTLFRITWMWNANVNCILGVDLKVTPQETAECNGIDEALWVKSSLQYICLRNCNGCRYAHYVSATYLIYLLAQPCQRWFEGPPDKGIDNGLAASSWELKLAAFSASKLFLCLEDFFPSSPQKLDN